MLCLSNGFRIVDCLFEMDFCNTYNLLIKETKFSQMYRSALHRQEQKPFLHLFHIMARHGICTPFKNILAMQQISAAHNHDVTHL